MPAKATALYMKGFNASLMLDLISSVQRKRAIKGLTYEVPFSIVSIGVFMYLNYEPDKSEKYLTYKPLFSIFICDEIKLSVPVMEQKAVKIL